MSNWPVLTTYDQDHLAHVALPLGGIGTGTVSLGGRGDLRDWELMNNPNKYFRPTLANQGLWAPFFALRTKAKGEDAQARALEGPIESFLYEGNVGVLEPNHGLPRFRKCSFNAAYPFGQVCLDDPDSPVSVRLEAFNPLVPGDADASGYPAAVLRFVLTNKTGKAQDASVCGNVSNYIGYPSNNISPYGHDETAPTWRNKNTKKKAGGITGIFMSPKSGDDKEHDAWGTMALSTLATNGVSCRTAWAELSWGDALLDYWDEFLNTGELTDRKQVDHAKPVGSVCVKTRLAARQTKTVTFLLSWHFPNRRAWSGFHNCKPDEKKPVVGNYYTTQFADAWDAAAKLSKALPSLETKTVAFVESFCKCDLPQPIKEAALYNISTLRSETSFRTPDGILYGWEGIHHNVGSCQGSCTHVWNYEVTTAFLFPELARSMRVVEFNYSTDKRGHMDFRCKLPPDPAAPHGTAAADGQMGAIMKMYREWQLSGDDAFLRELWPQVKKALEFCWIPGGWDADKDGVMEGCQHNTMDVEYYGPNPQMGAWYLGALRAAEEMAAYLGETDFASTCRTLFEKGQAWLDAHLFNGQYYEHEIRPAKSEKAIAPGLRTHMGAANLKDPELQLGSGCLVDQLVGQYMAHICGLGYLLKPAHIRKTLRSIMKYNWRSHFHSHFNHLRSFVQGDEQALLMASYPLGRRPERPFPYYNEVMTGFEHSTAAHMLYEGQETNALKVIDAIRRRYDGKKRNPFNEAECGFHYARAMAAWAEVLAWTGFHYSAVSKTLSLGAREGTFFWSTGSAWGTYTLKGKTLKLEVQYGSLALASIQVGNDEALVCKKTVKANKALRISRK